MTKTALVTGGAGYIGSHCAEYLNDAGWKTVVLDDLELGHKEAVINSDLFVGSAGDAAMLDNVFASRQIDAVLHFAAWSQVGESMRDPAKYYENNVGGGLTLIKAMIRHGVHNLVFSSTAAVYGDPVEIPITEEHPLAPINPYGYSKMVFERMALDMSRTTPLRPVFLRYFNAAGADPDGRLGEDHDPESHLIPIVIETALGIRESVSMFGSDYPTPDGTCIRDYIHITDLADAHLRSLEYIIDGGQPTAFNLGNGHGFSVREVIETVKKVSGKDVNVIEADRRPGDPATLIASSDKARKVLGWEPRFASLESIVQTAYDWKSANPKGFGG